MTGAAKSISPLTTLGLVGSGVLFVLTVTTQRGEFGAGAVLFGSVLTSAVGVRLRSAATRLMLDVYALAIFIGITARLAAILVLHFPAKFENKTTADQVIYAFDQLASRSLVLMLVVPLVALLVDATGEHRKRTGDPQEHTSRRHSNIVIVLSLAYLIFSIVSPDVVDVSSGQDDGSGPLGFVIRLIPVGFLPYAAISILRNRPTDARLAYVAIALISLAGVLAARKGALLTTPFAAIVYLAYLRQHRARAPRQLKAIVLLGAILGPMAFAILWQLRLDPGAADPRATNDTAMSVLSERLSIVDPYVDTSVNRPLTDDQVTFSLIAHNVINASIPGFDVLEPRPSLGHLFSVNHQLHQEDVRHAGAWSWWGLAQTIAPDYGTVLLVAAWVTGVAAILRLADRVPLASLGLVPFLADRLVFTWMISGNVDRVLPLVMIEIVAATFWFRILPQLFPEARKPAAHISDQIPEPQAEKFE